MENKYASKQEYRSHTETEIKEVMRRGLPVQYNGIKYACIVAFSYEVTKPNAMGLRDIYTTVALKDRRANSIMHADSKKIVILEA